MARTVMVFGRYCAQFPSSQEFAACLGSQPQWPLTTAPCPQRLQVRGHTACPQSLGDGDGAGGCEGD